MDVISDLDQIVKMEFASVVTLGNFDGIHLGHRKIIARCVDEAKRINAKAIVVTYDHQSSAIFKEPREFISLTDEKIEILKNLGVDILILIPFTDEIKNMRADIFLRELLIEKLNAHIFVIGYDHHFGKNREGNISYLNSRSGEFNYKVIQVDPVYNMDRIISSSRIRSDLVMGNIKRVNDLLGFEYFLSGCVIKGFQRGGETGFPTANIEVNEKKLLPLDGVYVGKLEVDPGKNKPLLPCVVNIGKNPTFNNEKTSIEVHILDFSENLYDKTVRLYFIERLRDEIKFDGIESLKKQIQADVKSARTFFK